MNATSFYQATHGNEEFLSKEAVIALMDKFHTHFFTEANTDKRNNYETKRSLDVNLGVPKSTKKSNEIY